jgi:hypothetical protein
MYNLKQHASRFLLIFHKAFKNVLKSKIFLSEAFNPCQNMQKALALLVTQ